MIVTALNTLQGPRSVWLDPYGRLWHGSPRQELPNPSWRAVGTFARPSRDHVGAAVAAVLRLPRPLAADAAA